MKASRRFDRGYETLTASERFRLLVGAKARDDESEVERLQRSCPRYTVYLRDPALTDHLECSCRLTISVIAALDTIEGRLNALAGSDLAARTLFTMAADEVEYEAFCLTGELQPSLRRAVRRERGRFRKLVREILSTLQTDGASLAHAFAVLCRDELKVDPQQLIATFASALDGGLYRRFIALSPDNDAVEDLHKELSAAWQAGIGGEGL